MDGKNVADFIDPDIAEKLEALEARRELETEGFYDIEEHMSAVSPHPFVGSLTLTTGDSDDEGGAELANAKEHLLARSGQAIQEPAAMHGRRAADAERDVREDDAAGWTEPDPGSAEIWQRPRAARKRKRDEAESAMDVDAEARTQAMLMTGWMWTGRRR